MGTFIHGVAASENIDSSGEIVSIAGLDISSLDKDGVMNYEHKSDLPAQVVGKILKAKKIFSDADCDDEHQLYFWNKVQTPYLYIMGELLDDYSDSAREVAARFRYDLDHKGQNERALMNFSVEGSKISKENIIVTRSIARKVTLTVLPCNKAAVAEMVPAQTRPKDDIDELFKTEPTEIEVFIPSPTSNIWDLLKKEDPNKHAAKLGIKPFKKDLGGGATTGLASTALSGVTPTSAAGIIGAGGMMDSEEMKKAPQHRTGTGVTVKDDRGNKLPKIPGAKENAMKKANPKLSLVGGAKPPMQARGNQIGLTSSGKGVFSHGMVGDYEGFGHKEHSEASAMHQKLAEQAKEPKIAQHHSNKAKLHHARSVTLQDRASRISPKGSSTPSTPKPPSGSPVHTPSSSKLYHPGLSGTAKKSEQMNKALTAGSGIASPSRLTQGSALAGEKVEKSMQKPMEKDVASQLMMNKHSKSMKKSVWLQKAEDTYQQWEKREQFETFMKSRMPHLTKSEIKVIGQTMLLQKTLHREKLLKDFYDPSVLRGSEKNKKITPKK